MNIKDFEYVHKPKLTPGNSMRKQHVSEAAAAAVPEVSRKSEPAAEAVRRQQQQQLQQQHLQQLERQQQVEKQQQAALLEWQRNQRPSDQLPPINTAQNGIRWGKSHARDSCIHVRGNCAKSLP